MTDRSVPCALVVMGVASSGKSTIARQLAARLNWIYQDGDDFHPTANVQKMSAGEPLTDADRGPWLQAIAAEIENVCGSGRRTVMACSALKRSYRDILVHGRNDIGIVYLKGSRELIARRMAARKNHFMPPKLLESQFATLQEPGADEHAFVVDIDASVDDIVSAIIAQLPPGTALGSTT